MIIIITLVIIIIKQNSQVANEVQHIIDSHQNTGLHLNSHKCEIIANNFELVDQYPIADRERGHESPWCANP